MKTFEHFNQTGDNLCPICGTNDDKPVVLIPIMGTEKDNNIQAIQVHDECLSQNLVLIPIMGTEKDNNIQAIQVHDECLSQNLVYNNEIIPHLIFAVANQ